MFFYTFLPKLLNMSLTAGIAILFVLLLRLPLKRAPKVISYALWTVVLFRLLCPVAAGSGFSLFSLFDVPTVQSDVIGSSMEYVPADIVHAEYPEVKLPIPGVSEAINEALPQGEEQLRADPLEGPVFIATYVWMVGVLGMAAYSAAGYIRLKRSLMASMLLRDNIYLADGISSPFVMGLVRPRIYLPSSLAERERDYIILHEQRHIRRLDHIIKALAFAALCIHWFNPLVWLAFALAGKDMEMSCDEAVIKKLGESVKADYSASLLSLATGRRIIAGVPLAFGEGDTKGRIKNLASRKKPAFWVVPFSVAACIALVVGLATNPVEEEADFSFLNYKNAIPIVADMEELTAIYCPSSQSGSDNIILIGAANGPALAKYLEQWEWRKCAAPRSALPTPGSVEFVIEEDYRITVHQRKSGSIRHYGEVEYRGETRYYSIDRNDYPDAVALVHAKNPAVDTAPAVQEWFNYLDSPADVLWPDSLEIEIPAFPDLTFRWVYGSIEAGNKSAASTLLTGMPIWNAFFADLSGDGLPEICATVSYASGMIDNRIVVHDYAAGATYELEDRGTYDYELALCDGRLLAIQSEYNGKPVALGPLSLVDKGDGTAELQAGFSPAEGIA